MTKETLTDIQSRQDIQLLVDEFYKRVMADDLIGVFFTEVVKLDWNTHIPIMYDFWETTILGKPKYKGNPMLKHIQLNEKKPLMPQHFERWLLLWEKAIHENFAGVKAEETIARAKQIGALMEFKIKQAQGKS